MRLLPHLFALLALVAPARGEIFEIVATGSLSSGTGIYANLPAGSTFTFSETFNTANATLFGSDASDVIYIDPTGTSSFNFDDLTFPQSDPIVGLTADSRGLYGFNFGQLSSNNPFYGIQLEGPDSTLVQLDSLPNSLRDLETVTISDFSTLFELAQLNSADRNDSVYGKTTSFSIQEVAAPEPASFALAALGILTILWLRQRQFREKA